jgi:hypothetical protein
MRLIWRLLFEIDASVIPVSATAAADCDHRQALRRVPACCASH